MRLLYLSYWSIYDPLAQASVYPGIRALANLDEIREILVVSIERASWSGPVPDLPRHPKVKYEMISGAGYSYFSKLTDFLVLPLKISRIATKASVDIFLGRGALAGALLYLISRQARKPFVVESFEPHAEYMVESKVWKRRGLRYVVGKFLEGKQAKCAEGLITVTDSYRRHLVSAGVCEDRVRVVPCTVEQHKFSYSVHARHMRRKELSIPDAAIVGVYVGKFGDIYFDLLDAFREFRNAFLALNGNFHLLLITQHDQKQLFELAERVSIPKENIHVRFVKHNEVPAFLSASDFAYALIKPSPSKRYCSAIKIGEYWASGLPVVLPEGIGDDSKIVEENNAGARLSADSPYMQTISKLVNEEGHRERIAILADRFRSPKLLDAAYSYFFREEYIQQL